jgi:antitoxin component of MazEF toxin-antitoxin module
MHHILKIEKIGSSHGIILSADILSFLDVGAGDSLFFVKNNNSKNFTLVPSK